MFLGDCQPGPAWVMIDPVKKVAPAMLSTSRDLGPNSAKSQNDAKYIYRTALAVSQSVICLLSLSI